MQNWGTDSDVGGGTLPLGTLRGLIGSHEIFDAFERSEGRRAPLPKIGHEAAVIAGHSAECRFGQTCVR